MDKHLLLLSASQEKSSFFVEALAPLNYKVMVKNKLASAMKIMHGRQLIILDLPDGVSALKEIKQNCPDSTVIVSAAANDASRALELGAYQCLDAERFDAHALRAAVKNASFSIDLLGRIERMKEPSVSGFIYRSEQMGQVMRKLRKLSTADAPVLVVGEGGTGKDLVAETMHCMGPRRLGPFIKVNCTDGVESEFFGSNGHPGKIFDADGGTLFIKGLDANLSDSCKAKFAELLETGTLPSSDGGRPVKLDVRILASATKEASEATNGLFKNKIELPPLRERKEDIVPLAEHFLKEASDLFGTGPARFTKDAVRHMIGYAWPGNSSELKNVVRRACMLSGGADIEAAHLSMDTKDSTPYCSVKDFLEAKLARFVKGMVKLDRSGLYESVIGEVEKSLIEIVLSETGGNQLKAANVLGITRTTLRTKIKSYNLQAQPAQKARKGRPPRKGA